MKFILTLLATILASKFSFAQSGLSLNEAITVGREHNPQLKVEEAKVYEARSKKREAFGAYLPRVDIIANHFLDIKYQQIQISPTSVFETIFPKTNFGAQASLNLFDGFKTSYFYSAQSENEEAAILDYEFVKMATENSIRLKYYQALGAQALEEVALANIKTLTEHYKRAAELQKLGEFTKVDVLKVQVQLESAIPEGLSASDTAKLSRLALDEVMGGNTDTRALSESLPIPDPARLKNLDSDNSKLSQNRLDLKALIKRIQASSDQYKASQSIWMPKINLMANYDYYNNRNFSLTETEKFRNAYAVGVNLVWNLFDGGTSYAREESSYYQKLQLEEKAKKVRLSSENEIELWKRKYNSNVALYSAKQRAVEASKESVRIYKTALKAGTRTNTDLLDAELELVRAQAGVVKAQVEALEALLNLELATGRRL